jgi:hypothetical protein
MTGRPRKGRRVIFQCDHGTVSSDIADPVSGLRFTITAGNGGDALIDFAGLRPRRLALAFARALRHLAAPGGPLGARSTVKAYAVSMPQFFAYLSDAGEQINGAENLQGRHVDGFETWLEAAGYSRIHLFTVLVKLVAVLRQIAADEPTLISPDLNDRLHYVSAKPFQRSRPRDAYSPFVARQLHDATRTDVAAVMRRLRDGSQFSPDPVLQRMESAVHAVIEAKGVIRHDEPAFKTLYWERRRRGMATERLGDEVNDSHHLSRDDVIPFLVLFGLETGLEIECCKALTIDCLSNATGGTVEVAYLKRRARGGEHKRIRVRDGSPTSPGGLIRLLIELTAAARRHRPSENLWVYRGAGAFTDGIRHPQMLIDAWTRRHGLTDDVGRPFRLLLSHLRKTHKALWYLKTEGHMTRFAVGHTVEVAARHYADIPALRPLHDATVTDALEGALKSALTPLVLTPEQEDVWRADPASIPDLPARNDPIALLNGDQDVWLAGCGGFFASPHGTPGLPCPVPFWGCLECSNAVITARKLPAILSFLDFMVAQRQVLSAGDWAMKFGRAHARIRTQILPAFGQTVVDNARMILAATPMPVYLPPEVRL